MNQIYSIYGVYQLYQLMFVHRSSYSTCTVPFNCSDYYALFTKPEQFIFYFPGQKHKSIEHNDEDIQRGLDL